MNNGKEIGGIILYVMPRARFYTLRFSTFRVARVLFKEDLRKRIRIFKKYVSYTGRRPTWLTRLFEEMSHVTAFYKISVAVTRFLWNKYVFGPPTFADTTLYCIFNTKMERNTEKRLSAENKNHPLYLFKESKKYINIVKEAEL